MKKHAKFRFLTLLAVLLLCVSLLAACASGEEPGSEPELSSEFSQSGPDVQTSEMTEEIEPMPTETESAEPTVMYDGPASVTDLYRGEVEAWNGETYEQAIPYIDMPGEAVAELNEIFRECYESNLDENGVFSPTYIYTYEWYVNGDILSLLVKEVIPPSGNAYYKVYNIRVSTCALVTDTEVLAAAGVEEEEFYTRVKDILGNAYFTEGYVRLSTPDGDDPIEYFREGMESREPEALSATVSQENVADCVPYLNEKGELCLRGQISTGVGPEWYNALFVYGADYEISPYYGEYLEKYGSAG